MSGQDLFERPRAMASTMWQPGSSPAERQLTTLGGTSTSLARELSISQTELDRRTEVQQTGGGVDMGDVNLRPPLYSTTCHSDDSIEKAGTSGDEAEKEGLVSKWRPKERLKTTAVALVVCLNIGVDPPDIVKVSPCARFECWIDPLSMQPQKALEAIGKSLQAQYERWQPRAKYRVSLDPTLEDVKKLCVSYRRAAKSERVLFHYNGHGVPKPTLNGEMWVFNKSYTQYIPLSMYDLQTWLSKPSIYVLDCPNAGTLMNAFENFALQRYQESAGLPVAVHHPPGRKSPPRSTELRNAMQDVILLGACGMNETLPQNVSLPADLFTSCLTTPIKIALRWFCSRSLLRNEGLNLEMIDRIPGKQTDRKTLLGELNWIFTAITDTIAWNVLPRPLFQKLFRQDLLVASLFRNFLLAERIMRAFGCMPLSCPALPPTHQHAMWHAWDLAAETCLAQLPGLLSGDPSIEYHPSSFFTEQLTAFEVWLEHGSRHKPPPEQLPIVLQVLLSQSHRLRALVLLGRFLDMGTWAVDLALSVGIFPYVLKLLQTTANELRQILVFIWTKILALDQSCKIDLTKDSSFMYFIRFLEMPDSAIPSDSKAGAAFILSVICHDHTKGQKACASAKLIEVCLGSLQDGPSNVISGSTALLAQWLCLCLGKIWENSFDLTMTAFKMGVMDKLSKLLTSASPNVRAAAVFALGSLIVLIKDESAVDISKEEVSNHIRSPERMVEERSVAGLLLTCANDGSPLVRQEVIHALGRFAMAHTTFIDIAHQATESLSGGFSRRHGRSPSTMSDIGQSSFTSSASGSHRHSAPDVKPNQAQSSESSFPPPQRNNVNGQEARAVNLGGGKEELSITYSQLYQNTLVTIVTANFDPSPRVTEAAKLVLQSCFFQVVPLKRPAVQKSTSSFSFSPKRKEKSKLHSRFSMSSERLAALNSASPGEYSSSFGRSYSKTNSPKDRLTDLAEHFNVIKTSTEVRDPIQSRVIPHSFPNSEIFEISCKYFASPLLSAGDEACDPSWPDNLDPLFVADRKHRMEESFALARNICPQGLDHQLAVIENANETIKALAFEALDDKLYLADAKGYLSVRKVTGPSVNRFHAKQGEGPGKLAGTCDVTYISILNPEYNPLLLAATTDGSVAIYKDTDKRGRQKQASSFMAIPQVWGMTKHPAIIESNSISNCLYASGCSKPQAVHIWDLQREVCTDRITGIDHNILKIFSSSEGQPNLLVGCESGSVLYYDLRDPRHYISWSEPYEKRLVGMAMVNNDMQIVAGYANGRIKVFDIRAGLLSKLKDFEGHDSVKSRMTSFAAHRCGTIFATASTHSVKVWNSEGQLLSTARPHGNFLPRSGSVDVLAFHPTRHLLSAGGSDSATSVYCSYG
ncbi:regulatory-associated protein of TOR [Chloropicon primus]|uniref:Regulatory-associated protein of TOR n=3 Tax=Chloropicon primus TaxID=1764295 RepID=A0A5B8MK79_9CHLO|nr:regulatory-associated protein of TOR [Chloropicon primus]UPQ99317.1 regulatory-associated protein of TOR [Chloropicon primus]|eukprot:QDZ20105.1 regulatory-associated protein of TOR [Chloropicon primus]